MSHEDLKDIFDGKSCLYVINVTKQGTDNLSIDKIESLFKTLQKNMPEKEPYFIVFNEYFFGKEPLDIEIKKALLRWFDKIENAIFVVNFILSQKKLICVYEIDRIANIVYNSMVHEQLLAQKLQIPQQKVICFH